MKIEIPIKCPICQFVTEFDGEYLICPNSDGCPAQVVGRIKSWISNLNLLEWGDTLMERLVETNKVSSIVDLYKLSTSDLASIERMGEKSAQKCYDILHSNKELPIEILLGSLNIPMIGTSMIKMVTSAGYDSLEKIMNLTKLEIENISGLGPAKADSLYNGLRKNKQLIDDLLQVGIKIKQKAKGKLTGKVFAITGSTNMKRGELEKIIINYGGEFKSSATKGCTHLIIADINSNSTKAINARKLRISLITEEDFLKMVI